MKNISVLLADDEESVVEVLRAAIGTDAGLRVVGWAHDAEHAIELAMQTHPDVAVVDVRMPGGGGLRAAREISRRCAPTKVVALSAHEDVDTMIRMMGAGARAYVPKDASLDRIIRAIHRCMDEEWTAATAATAIEIEDIDPSPSRQEEQRQRVGRAILDGAVSVGFESILDLESGEVGGIFARTKVAVLPYRPFDAWLADADACGLLDELELSSVRGALRGLRRSPKHWFVQLPVSPATVRSGRFKKAIGPVVAERVVLSVSDLAPGDRVDLEASLAPLRARGSRVAVTDVGSELAGLERLIRLSPEFVEVDEAITRGIHRDTSRHAVVAALASCAEQLGAHVVATGVTSKAQLEELGRLGARFVRGPFVSRVTQGLELGKALDEGSAPSVKSRSGDADDLSDGVPPSSIGGDG